MKPPVNIAEMPCAALINEGDKESLASLLKAHKLTYQEYQTLREIMQRTPTFAELGVFSSMWSEHCSYKSSRVHLGRFPTEGDNVVVGPGENAGVVRLHGKLCVAFKMESHNHPSYIEPYQGAATGVGGILRDVFCMGARPVANLNCLRFGKMSHPRTPYLFENVVKGIGDYGNCIGVPTVGGNIAFDATYDGNCLVNAMTVGLIHEDKIFKGFATGSGNLLVYVGSATGRDGIHGATMASDSFDSSAAGERSAVQVGDPFTEKLLLEATLECLDKGLVVGLQDMGAAGLTSSSFEMAGRAGNGLYVDLEKIPVRTDSMSAYELLLSETQERMLMVIEPKNWDALAAVLEKWQLAYDVIGSVTDTGRIQAVFQGKLELDVPVAPLTDLAPKYERPCKPRQPLSCNSAFDSDVARHLESTGIQEVLQRMLASTGAKDPVYDQYDQDIGTKTVLNSRHGGAAVVWPRSELTPDKPYLGLAVSTACNSRYCHLDAKSGASMAVLKAARMIAAAGGTPLAVTDCLNYGNPEDPEVMQEFSDGVDGISEACKQLGVAVVSGNVSLYNETDGESIMPTPMIGMVGRVDDVRQARPAIVTQPSRLGLLFPKEYQTHFGGSEIACVLGLNPTEGRLAPINWQAELAAVQFLSQFHSGLRACRDVEVGGVALALVKMVLAEGSCGFQIEDNRFGASGYFSETGGKYLLAFDSEQSLARAKKNTPDTLVLASIGSVQENQDLVFANISLPRAEMLQSFRSAMKF